MFAGPCYCYLDVVYNCSLHGTLRTCVADLNDVLIIAVNIIASEDDNCQNSLLIAGLEDLLTIAVCVGGCGLAAVCKLLAEDFSGWAGKLLS